MITFEKESHSFSIHTRGGDGEWIGTLKALVRVFAHQRADDHLDVTDQYFIASLIEDMLPTEQDAALLYAAATKKTKSKKV